MRRKERAVAQSTARDSCTTWCLSFCLFGVVVVCNDGTRAARGAISKRSGSVSYSVHRVLDIGSVERGGQMGKGLVVDAERESMIPRQRSGVDWTQAPG